MVRIRTPVIGLALSGLLSLSGVAAHANAPMPAPGRPDRVAALVAGSHDIDQLPSNLLPALSQASGDDAPAYYPITESGCTGVSKCAFGDLASHRTVVLFGDSHALMWLPALVPVARSQHFRLVLIWKAACPAADVAVWDSKTNTVFAACNKFRWASILAIRALGPALVLLASRTSRVLGPHKGPISDDVWRAGLERTIGLLSIHKTRVAIIGDITMFSTSLPDCLAAYPTDVQSCSVPDPNPQIPGHYKAEVAAASAKKALYVDPARWLCTSVCSPIIGNMIGYFDSGHVTATYAEYLANVWGEALRPLLR